jgi:putative glutathione S-transferase
MLINGKWSKAFDPVQADDGKGRFLRQDSIFRNWITPDGRPGPTGRGGFAAAPDRYHLYVALICPWACRTLMARKLKGLEKVISVTVVEPFLYQQCWRFGDYPGAQPEPFYGVEYLHELYTRARPDYTGQVTVPVLWDKKQHCMVNNESADLIRLFNSGFGTLADTAIDLYPHTQREAIDALNDRLYDSFNNGVYRAGFATTQSAYEEAVAEVFDRLALLEQRLKGHEYLMGHRLTEADIRAFVTLVRFDVAYHGLFKTNLAQLRDYENLSAYIRRIYQLPGMATTVNFDHIKQGYYSIKALNPSGIVPAGPDLSHLIGSTELGENHGTERA